MIRFEKVSKIYRSTQRAVKALDRIDLEIQQGDFVTIQGPSGSGKTTLLLILGGMLRPTQGKVMINNNDLYEMGSGKRADYRGKNIGFVFQLYHLVPYLNIIENVLLARGAGSNTVSRPEARVVLEGLGLSDRIYHRPAELSAGERQRAALARALVNRPNLLLADEPTGNLDPGNSLEVLDHLSRYHREGGTVLVATHGSNAEKHATRTLRLEEGRILNSIRKETMD